MLGIIEMWVDRVKTQSLRTPRYDKVSKKAGKKAKVVKLFENLFSKEYGYVEDTKI